MKTHHPILCLLLILCGAISAAAQSFTATINGTVTDPNGAAVPGAKVTVTNPQTGTSRNVTTNADGSYVITQLQPSGYNGYEITVEADGFQKTTRQGIRLEVSQVLEVNLQLTIGTATQSVEISATGVQLVTEQSSVDTTIEQKFIEDLPLFDQNIFQFVQLSPGVVSGNPGNAAPIGDIGNRNFFDSNFSVNGGKASTNDVLLDGVSNTIGDFNGVGTVPPLGAVQEFKVLSGAYSSEFGRSGGGNVNMVTKSGTNRFTGTVYEFLQNSELNANGWARNRIRATQERVSNRRNHFGAAVGGPVWIPGLYNGKNKTFFFFVYEGRRNRDPFEQLLTVPTAKQRVGDFSETRNASGQLIQVFNPWTTRLAPGSTTQRIRDQFTDNKINCTAVNPATSRPFCDPVALKALSFYPQPNLPGDVAGVNNFIGTGVDKLDKNFYSARVDHNFTDSQRFFVRFTREKRDNIPYNPFGGNNPSNRNRVIDKFTSIVADYAISITPSLVNDFRYGYTRAHANQIPYGIDFDPTTLGLPSYLKDNAAILKFPTFSIGGNGYSYAALASGGFNNQPRDTTTIANSMTKIYGKHTIKPGFEYRLIRFFPFQVFNTVGNYGFGAAYTQRNPDAGDITSGHGFASFLLGAFAGSAQYEYGTPVTIFHHYAAAYVQDDWRVTPRLTLNLGLRWDVESGTTESHDRLTTFDFYAPSPLAGRVTGFPNLRGKLDFVGGNLRRAEWQADKNNFAPRIGLAYQLNSKTVVRAGYGLFYLGTSVENLGSVGFNYSISSTQPDARIPMIPLSNPFQSGIPAKIGKSQGSLSLIGQSITAVENKISSSYNQLFNLAVQRQLGRDWLGEIAYVGSRGVRLPLNSFNLNQLDPSQQALGNTALNQLVANPFAGVITDPLSPLSRATVQRRQLLLPFPQYTGVSYSRPVVNMGSSSYHSMQIKVQKRFSQGLSMLTHYTWSKLMDTGGVGNGIAFVDSTPIQNIYNIRDEYSLSNQDVPHRFVVSGTYELPFGNRKRFLNKLPGFANTLIGGWQINGAHIWQSGTPLSIIANNLMGIGNARMRASLVAGADPFVANDMARDNVRAGLTWFNTTAFFNPNDLSVLPSCPGAPTGDDRTKCFTLGNTSRTLGSVRRDRYRNVDFSLFKTFTLNERLKFQFRAEAFNLLNTVVFGTPDTNVNSSQFGRIVTQANSPRKVQLVARINF